MQLEGMRRFLASQAERSAIESEFTLVATRLVLGEGSRSSAANLPASGGCYFWTMDIGDERFKVYIGQTRSLQKRVTDYSVPIQIHSPNDFKLRFFQELAFELYPEAHFNLFFTRLPEEERKARETELVRRFNPLINTLRPPTAEDRAVILDGFRQYYRAAFAHRCGDA